VTPSVPPAGHIAVATVTNRTGIRAYPVRNRTAATATVATAATVRGVPVRVRQPETVQPR
jgi:hypothetical protein